MTGSIIESSNVHTFEITVTTVVVGRSGAHEGGPYTITDRDGWVRGDTPKLRALLNARDAIEKSMGPRDDDDDPFVREIPGTSIELREL